MTHNFPNKPLSGERTDQSVQTWDRRPSRRLLFVYSCAIAALTIAVDVLSKQLALHFLDTDVRIPLLGEHFGLQLAFNTGAAFSIGSQLTPFITLLGLIASVLLIRAAFRTSHRIFAASIGLILGGAIGNLVDRIFAPPGFGIGAVTDFLAYGQLFIGNIADVAIGAGVALYALGAWRLYNVSRTQATVDAAKANDTDSPPTDPATTSEETTHP